MKRIAVAIVLFLTACDSGTTSTGNQVQDACINVCMCFSKAQEINDCRSDCTRMAKSARLKAGRAFSGGSASYSGFIFWSGSGSAGTHVASGDCLSCLSGATCAQLEGGTACLNKCQSLVPLSSGGTR